MADEDVVYSPDGGFIALAGADGAIRLCDALSARETRVLYGHVGPVLSLAFDREGKRIVSGGSDQTVHFPDTAAGRRSDRSSRSHRSSDLRGISSSAGDQVVSAVMTPIGDFDRGCEVKQWDATTGKEIRTFYHPWGWLIGFATYSTDGRRIVTGSYLGTGWVRVWDAADGQLIAEREHLGSQCRISVSPRDGRIAVGKGDNTISLWSPDARQELQFLRGGTLLRSNASLSARMGDALSSPVAKTQPSGCGTSKPQLHYAKSPASADIPLRSHLSTSAPTGEGSSPRATTGRQNSGKPKPRRMSCRCMSADMVFASPSVGTDGGWPTRFLAICGSSTRKRIKLCEIIPPDASGAVTGFAFTPTANAS